MPLNVIQILAITSISFVLFSILWVMKVETYLEERERKDTDRRDKERQTQTETTEP